MTERFLNASKVGSALEQMGGRAVAQAVWAHVRLAGNGGEQAVHHAPHRSRIDAAAAGAEE